MQPDESVDPSDVASSPPAETQSSQAPHNSRRPSAGHTRSSSRGQNHSHGNHSHSHSHKPRHQFSHSVAVTTPDAPDAPFLPPTFFKVHGLHQRTLANFFFVGLLIFANVCLQVLSSKPPGLVAILFVNGLVLFAIRHENSASQQRNAAASKPSHTSNATSSDQVIPTRRVESFSSVPPSTVELPSISSLSSQVQESFREAQAIRKRQSHSQHSHPHTVARSSTAHGVTFDPQHNTVTVGEPESESEEDTGPRELTEEEMSRLCGFGGSAPKPKKEKPAAVAADSSREDSKRSDSSDEHPLTNTAHKILEEESHTSHGVSHGVLNNRDQRHSNNSGHAASGSSKRGSGNSGAQHAPARKASASQKADSSTQTADGLVKKPTSPAGPTPTPGSSGPSPSSPPGPAAVKSAPATKATAHHEEKTASKHAPTPTHPPAAPAHTEPAKHDGPAAAKSAGHHTAASESASPSKPAGKSHGKHLHEAADMPAPFTESAMAVAHPRRATIAAADASKHAHPEPRADLVPFPPVVRSNLPLCGDTLNRLKKEVGWEISWHNITAETFNVRCGPDYKKNGFKAPSKESMYDVIAIDIFKSESKVQRITNHIRLPDPREIYNRKSLGSHSEYKGPSPGLNLPDLADDEGWDFDALGVPPYFICNMQAPNYGPANPIWGSAKTDGENYCLIQYLALNKVGRAALKNNTPAGKLLRFFMNNCPDEKVADRFKGICRVENMDSLSLASFAGRYNAKPFLSRPQHTFYKGANYVEQFVDVHRFTYLARLGLWNYVMPIVQDMVFDLALVIESREESEMPEQILSAVRYTNLQFNNAVPFKTS